MIRESSIVYLTAAWVVLAQHSAAAFQISPLGSTISTGPSRRPATFSSKSNANFGGVSSSSVIFSPLYSSAGGDNNNDGEVRRQDGVKFGLGSFFTTTLAALALFLSVDEVAMQAYKSELIMAGNGLSNNVVAQAKSDAEPKKDIPAPPITATSSARALKIGADLKTLDAKMYGAYWCSHCFEQKQRLGKEAYYGNVQYVECSKEGLNSGAAFCKEQKVPGYPTWEIGGKQFPGDMYLDELEDIIKDVKSKQM
uniref:Thioredoxin domain-containing protein n=1 Tax=Chaetoceros debilis TaxID=122233 RepID=A0A7S3V726_9STRA|mmetsp:Transcript_14058/g.21008  ORF Transcript_14058/g.21008 Transcript_14058/m.21008 type:complete len:253 (+) Transcript_14058:114-872(+)